MEYIEHFRENSLDIQDMCNEKELVKICFQWMFSEYVICLENISLHSFSTLVENAWRTNNSLAKQLGERGKSSKRLVSDSFTQGKDSRGSKNARNDMWRSSTGVDTFPCSMSKVHAIFDRWVQDENIKLPRVEHQPTVNVRRGPSYCRYHRAVGHSIKDYRSLKQLFHERIQSV